MLKTAIENMDLRFFQRTPYIEYNLYIPESYEATEDHSNYSAKEIGDKLKYWLSVIEKNDYKKISLRDWKYVHELFWNKENPLAEYDSLIDFYIEKFQLKIDSVIGIVPHLIKEYPINVNEKPNFLRLYNTVSNYFNMPSANPNGWKTRHKEYNLFNIEKVETTLAEKFLDSNSDLKSFMEDSMLIKHGSFSEGLARSAFLKVLEITRNTPNMASYKIKKIIEWAECENTKKALRYQDIKNIEVLLAEALLLSFDGKEGSKALKKRIKDLLLTNLGDPRESSQWGNVSIHAKKIISKWIAEGDLDYFFGKLSEFANNKPTDDGGNRRWRDRKDFWNGYLDYIDESWLALCNSDLNEMEKDKDALITKGSYAKFEGRNGASVIFMKIDNLIISEWTTVGVCRIWNENNKKAPKLFQKSYDSAKIAPSRNSRVTQEGFFAISHNGGWKQKVEEYIKEKTGIQRSKRKVINRTFAL